MTFMAALAKELADLGADRTTGALGEAVSVPASSQFRLWVETAPAPAQFPQDDYVRIFALDATAGAEDEEGVAVVQRDFAAVVIRALVTHARAAELKNGDTR